jgi:anthranilate synthase/phosphoribosyltransferase
MLFYTYLFLLMRVLVLDNFDSFTYNLVDFFRTLGTTVTVFRNTVPVEVLEKEAFDLLVLSPGPSVPRQAGNMMAVIERFHTSKPILGVCLGHQALVEFFGGTITNIAPVHGKAVPIEHDGRGVFTHIEQQVEVARYHSWAADIIPSDLEVTSRSGDGVVMGVRHKKLPIEGIQFHPESVLTMKNNAGMRMLKNVVEGRLSAGNRIYHELSQRLQQNKPLGSTLLHDYLRAVEEGQLSDDQKQILLVSLSHRMRQPEILHQFIQAIMAFSKPLGAAGAHPLFQEAIDICGTGGSNLPRINTSTLVSLLLGSFGLKIAKHGNRAAAGRFGSFNLLEALEVPIQFDPDHAVQQLELANIAFVFAPDVHPVFRHFAATRAKIGVPTVFNVLGPLVNPLLPKRQFIGTSFEDLQDVIFETGILMGKEHLMVVRGNDGLDEISISAPTRVLEYRNGKRLDYTITPEDFGVKTLPFQAVSAPNGTVCTEIARAMLNGQTDTPHYQLVLINAAFIYSKLIEDVPLTEAYQKMKERLATGAMGEVLKNYSGAAINH